MDDIAPELLAKIEAAFKAECEKDTFLKNRYEKIQAGTATYTEAHNFAARVGAILAGVFGREITADALPDGRMYYNIAQRVLTPMLTEAAEIISDAAVQVQKSLNAAAGIGIKPIRAEVDAGRIEGFVNKVSSAERFEDVASVLGEPVTRYAQSVVDDTIKANADFQRKAGLRPKITRDAGANCCQWCADLEGTYIYGDHPDEIFQRHAFCRCTVTYDPGDGKITDVWSKKEYGSRAEAIEARREWNEKVEQTRKEARQLIGLTVRDTEGKTVQIRSVSGHCVERMTQRNIKAGDIANALDHPLQVLKPFVKETGERSFRVTGYSATAIINPDTGNLVTAWPTSAKRAGKLLR